MSTTKHYLDLVGLQSYDSKLKAYIQDKVTGHLIFELADSLEAITTPKENVIYLIPDAQGEGNAKREYMWINSAWELVGRTDVSLDGYVQTEDLDDYVLKSEHEAFETRITDVEGQAETNRQAIVAANEAIQGLSDTKADASNVYTKGEVDGKVDTLNQAIAGKVATGDFNALGIRVGANEQAIAALQTAIGNLANSEHTHTIEQVTGLQGELDTINGEIDSLQDETAGLSNRCDSLEANKLDASAVITETEIQALFAKA